MNKLLILLFITIIFTIISFIIIFNSPKKNNIINISNTNTTCPSGTILFGLGQSSNINNCNCPIEQIWNGTSCIPCPDGTNMSNEGGSHNIYPLCHCPTGYIWNGTSCIINNCPPNNILYNSSCIPCPNGTNISNSGGSHNIYTSCRCPLGQIWNGTSCVINCPIGTTTTGLGGISSNPNCKCINSNETWNGTSCVIGCPIGTTTTGLGGISSNPNCKCINSNETWNGTSCVIGCPIGQTWNGTSCVLNCPTGSSIYGTEEETPIEGCRCLTETPIYNVSTNYCNACRTFTVLNGLGGTYNGGHGICNCPTAGRYYDSTMIGSANRCVNCPAGTTINKGELSCH